MATCRAWRKRPRLVYNDEVTKTNWIEDVYGGRYCKVAADFASGDTTITLKDAGSSPGYIFTVGDIVKNVRTGENIKVASVAASSIGVTGGRGFGTTAAAAGLAGDGLVIVGNVNAEGSSYRNVNSTRSIKKGNLTSCSV